MLATLGFLKPFIMPAVLLAALSLGGLYVKRLQTENVVLEQNAITLGVAIDAQKKVIERQTEEIRKIQEAVVETQKLNNELIQSREELQHRFEKVKPDGTKRDIGKIAQAKDTLLERVINRGTAKAFNCFEDITDESITTSTNCND